ncbi:MAG: hypothetical protein ABH804_01015 [archaeon]
MSLKNKVIGGLVSLGIATGAYFAGSSMINADRKYERLFEEGKRQIVGTVLAESYQNTLSPVPNWNGLMSYSNETVKLESKYVLKVQTDDGRIIGVSVIDGDEFGKGKAYGKPGIPIKKEALDAIIGEGTRISFPSGNMRHGNWFGGSANRDYPNETYFTPETQAGNKRADRIRILPKD